MSVPRVSVVMPVYNSGRYVVEAVESVLGQTYEDFEFIIIDDGSTDETGELLRGFAARDGRVRLVSRANKGVAASLNEGLGMARGELIARMDGDDVCEAERFEVQVRYLDEHPECVAVGSRVLVIDPEGLPITTMPDVFEHEEIESALLGMGGQVLYHPSMILRRWAMERLGGYRARFRYTEDLDLFLRLMELGRVVNLREALLRYREHMGKVGAVRAAEQMREVLAITNERRARRGMVPLEPGKPTRVRGKMDRYESWGWWALEAGNRRTAAKYACRLLLSRPWRRVTWRLCYCVARGR